MAVHFRFFSLSFSSSFRYLRVPCLPQYPSLQPLHLRSHHSLLNIFLSLGPTTARSAWWNMLQTSGVKDGLTFSSKMRLTIFVLRVSTFSRISLYVGSSES